MAYRIKRKERVEKGIRRILREQIGRAAESARDRAGAQEERVHDVRTHLKRSRAALRLIRAQLDKTAEKAARKTDRDLRDRGRRLARPRDMIVQAHTFRILGARLSGELPAGLLERMRDVGEQLRRKLDEKSVDKQLRRTARSLRRLRKRLRKLPVKRGKRAVGEGITRTYREARRALVAVQAEPTPERFHDWRKQVKLLSNELKIVERAVPELATRTLDKIEKLGESKQVKLLSNELKIVERAVPELATRTLDKIEKLGEILGQIHDLDCAAATTERHPRWFGSADDCEAVRGLVAEHRVVLEREAFALAAGVFAGRPRDVRELVQTGWRAWRKGEPAIALVPDDRAA